MPACDPINNNNDSVELALAAVREVVAKEMNKYDPSHDMHHVDRVVSMAKRLAGCIARGEQPGACAVGPHFMLKVESAALLHDAKEFKYTESEEACAEFAQFVLQEHLPAAGLSGAEIGGVKSCVDYVIKNVSYKSELAKLHVTGDGCAVLDSEDALVLACVQDADRLDAIGAIGIARCMAYSGAKNTPIFDASIQIVDGMTKEEYMQRAKERKGTAANHFHEKLLKLAALMKTDEGRRIAERRHRIMADFIAELTAECSL